MTEIERKGEKEIEKKRERTNIVIDRNEERPPIVALLALLLANDVQHLPVHSLSMLILSLVMCLSIIYLSLIRVVHEIF